MARFALSFLALFACACAGANAASPGPEAHAHGHDGHEGHLSADHDFSDAASWSKVFDDPERDAWQKPDEVVKLMAIAPGMTVVDLGAGTGYFAKRLSDAAGPTGKLIALDVEDGMVSFMLNRFEKEGIGNATARQCPTDGTGLARGSADRVLIVDTWHHLGDRAAYAKHLARTLKPGGAVIVVDFTLEAKKGPPPAHRVAPDKVVADLSAAGLLAAAVEETLPDQYVVVAQKIEVP